MAYVSLLSTDNFLPGVLVLHYSLEKTAPEHPFIVLVTENVSEHTRGVLNAVNIPTRIIANERVPPWLAVAPHEHMPHWEHTFSKLQILRQTQLKKIVYVDADMLVCKTLERLFSKPAWSAVNAGGMLPEKAHWTQLNSGLMVVEPSAAAFEELMDCLRHRNGPVFSDQDCFHIYLPEWPKQTDLHLDHKYNMLANLFERYHALFGYRLPSSTQLRQDEAEDNKLVHVLHFVGPAKPWGVVHEDHKGRQGRMDQTTSLWLAFFREMCAAYGLDPECL